MKIKERIEIMLNRAKNPEDVIIHVFDNTSEYNPLNEWFFLCDYQEFKDLPVLGKTLDTENQKVTKKQKNILLGFSSGN